MNYAMFVAYAVVMIMAPIVPFLVYSFVKEARAIYKTLRVLHSEKRAGETLYDTAEAIAGDAHNWRGLVDVSDDARLVSCDTDSPPASGVYTKAQPPPQNSDGRALWPLIISELGRSETDRLVAIDMQRRHEFGIAKYGVPLVASNGRDHLSDAYQEALDCVVYLRAAIESQLDRRVDETDTRELKGLHQLYVDMLDMAKENRELIHERDGQ